MLSRCGLLKFNFLTLSAMIPPELLLQGYRLGVFPMAMEDDSIGWFSPDPRAIIPLEDFHVPHALRRVWRNSAQSKFRELIICVSYGERWNCPENFRVWRAPGRAGSVAQVCNLRGSSTQLTKLRHDSTVTDRRYNVRRQSLAIERGMFSALVRTRGAT